MRGFFQDSGFSEALPYEDNQDNFGAEVERLCHRVSRTDFNLTAKVSAAFRYKDIFFSSQDYYGELEFFINDEEAFTMKMSPFHGLIKPNVKKEGDWRVAVDLDLLRDTLPPETLASFVTPENLGTLVPKLSLERRNVLMQSLDFRDQEMKIAAVRAIFKSAPTLKFLAASLMRAIYHLEDTREDDVLMSTLISLYEENNASEQEIEDILQEFPRFLGAEISVPRIGSLSPQLYYTQKRLILYALMHKKISWIKVTLPKIKYIQLQWDEDDKPYLQDFFKTYLPTCKNLETLFLGNCLTNQEVLLLREELKFLRNLKEVRISFKEDDVSLVLSLIEVFPSSVKRFLTGLYNGDLETKDGIRRLESFKEIIGQVFDKNPSLFIQLDIPSPPRAYTHPEEYPKYSEVAKNRIREILGVVHVPEERIKLRFS